MSLVDEVARAEARESLSRRERWHREAAVRRERVGSTRVPQLEDAVVALAAVSAMPAGGEADGWMEGADLSLVSTTSHRRFAGGIVRLVKHALVRFLGQEFDQQTRLNREAARELLALRHRARAALDSLGGRIEILEGAVGRLGGRVTPSPPVFDYAAFEATFRTDSESLRRSLEATVRILESAPAGPILDLGCGKGDLLAMLLERGIEAIGVDLDRRAVATARARGLAVTEGELLGRLRSCPDRSLAGVVSLQVIEHGMLRDLLELLSLARTKLLRDGILMLETVNVSSCYALTHGWSIDPTHRQRLHPELLRALALHAGFRRVDLRIDAPVPARDRLELADGTLRLDWLFGPQDVALVARL